MACGATLKRSLEFDPLHSPSSHSPKRRRCMPMTIAPSTPPTKQHQQNPSPFGEVSPKLTSEQIAANVHAELRRLQRRKLLQNGGGCSPPHSSSSTDCLLQSSSSTFFNALSLSKKDMPLFTFRQVSLVCERMLKERETQIKEEYDKVLNCKIAEQYEAFLRFNHDQLHKRFGEGAASYVS